MSISELFIKRPVMTTLVTLAIVVAGIAGYRALPVSDLPSVEFPTIQVSAGLPGASPETMAAAVAAPLERQFSTIPGLSSMSSTSTLGSTQVTLQFELDRSIDAAALDVQAMIARAGPQLPPDLPAPPTFQKVNPAEQPVLYLALSSTTLPLSDVDEYAETTIAQRVSMVEGVALVNVYGAQKYAVRVQVDPEALAARAIGIDEVATAVQQANVSLPTGVLQDEHQALTVQASGQLTRAAGYRPVIVAYRNGSPVRLAEVGLVLDSVENTRIASWYNEERAIVLAIQKQPGTNTVAVIDAVFIPVLFMAGILGRLLHELAVTISAAILLSGVVALSVTPTLASRILRPPRAAAPEGGEPGPVRSGGAFARLTRGYERTLRAVLRHRLWTLLVAAALLAGTGCLVAIVPKGLLPSEDTGQLFAVTQAAQGVSFEAMARHQQEVARVAREDPSVDSVMSAVGSGGANATTNTGRLFLRLKPRSERRLGPDEVIRELRPKLAAIPGVRVFLQNPPAIRIGGQLTSALYQLTLTGPDTDALYRAATAFEGRMRALPGLEDVTSDLQIQNPELNLDIDRDKAAALGLSARQIEEALSMSYAQRQVSTILAPTNQYRVIMELEPRYQRDPGALSLLHVRSSGDALVPLTAVTRASRSAGPLSVNHLGQLPAVTLSFNLGPSVSLGDAVARVGALARAELPATISTSFQGSAQAFQASRAGLGLLIALAILIIYVVLGILYESFIHPLTILSGLPSAGFGALLALLVFREDLNLYSFVGILLLIGIVKKNAIMMIDFALLAERREGKSPADAIYEGCLVRFRPIMMTTLAAFVGTLPIALGLGAGAEARRPLGIAVVGGLLVSQLLTLYITPVIYTYLDVLQRRLGGILDARRRRRLIRAA